MRIAFITDLHIDTPGQNLMGVDVRQNFLKALAFLPTINPSCLVIGGDLANAVGDRAIYAWIKQELDKLPYPYYLIAGNHDDPAILADVFGRKQHLQDNEFYYALPLEGRPTLFLDTAKGELSPKQWTWLKDYVAALRHNNLLVFMHHPPLPADAIYMDSHYPFRQSDDFLQLMKSSPCHITVVCGHYHAEKVVQRGNLIALLTPSTFVQLKQDTPDMVVDNYCIGIREINLTTHGTNSTVHYL